MINIYYEKRNNSRVSIGKETITIRLPKFLNRDEKIREESKLVSLAKKKILYNYSKNPIELIKEYDDGEEEGFAIHIKDILANGKN
jgi:hypothetical protein